MSREHLVDSRFGGMRTNLVGNPSFEGATNPTTLRTNLATTPDGRTVVSATGALLGWNNSRWFGTGGAGTYTPVTGATDGPLPSITAYLRKAWTTAGVGGDTGINTNAWTGLTAGAVYAISGWIRSSIDRTSVGWEAWFSDATGVFQRQNLSNQPLAANVWQRFSIIVTAPPTGAVSATFILDIDGGQNLPIGTTVDVTGLLVEQCGTGIGHSILPGATGTVIRTNLHTNPAVGRNLTNWGAVTTGITATNTRETSFAGTTITPPVGSSTWYKSLWPTAPTTSPATINVTSAGASGIPVTAGLTYTFSAYVISSWTGFGTVRLDIGWYTAAGASISSETTAQAVLATAAAWERRVKTLVAPAGAAFASVGVAFSGPMGAPANTWIGSTGVQIEQAAAATTYFDGMTSGSTSEYGFTAAPHNSTSVNRNLPTGVVADYFDGAARPALRTNLCPNPSFETNMTGWATSGQATATRSNEWASQGAWSAKAVSSPTASVSTSGDLRLTGGGASSFPLGIVPGGTYTVSADLTCPVPLVTYSTVAASRQKRICLFYSINGVAFIEAFGPQAPNTPGVHRVSHTFTLPANATGCLIGLGVAGSPEDMSYVTYYDRVSIEATSTSGLPYFDGATAQPAGFGAAWSGAANASPSYTYDADLTANWASTAFASQSNLSGVGIYGTTGNSDRASLQSSQWADTRTKSLRIIPGRTSNNDTFAEIRNMMPSPVPLAGKTVRMTVMVRLVAPQTGVLDSNARRFRVGIASVTTPNPVVTYVSQAPNAAGVYKVEATFVMPADATAWSLLRLYNGAFYGGGDVWFDSLLIEEVDPYPASPVYFDGTYRNAKFTGTADQSSSIGYGFVGVV